MPAAFEQLLSKRSSRPLNSARGFKENWAVVYSMTCPLASSLELESNRDLKKGRSVDLRPDSHVSHDLPVLFIFARDLKGNVVPLHLAVVSRFSSWIFD